METLSSYIEIKDRIKAASSMARTRCPVELVAVSKFQTIEKIIALYQEGQRVFGENYVQELIEKKANLDKMGITDLKFHFIGGLQTNKVKLLLPHVDTIHSVDSLRLLSEIEKRAREINKKIRVYIQLNIDEEESKGGFLENDLPELEKQIVSFQYIESLGFMSIPNPDSQPNVAFSRMKKLSLLYGESFGSGLSMGMSDDFEKAISYGSTCVRIGSALFGPRTS